MNPTEIMAAIAEKIAASDKKIATLEGNLDECLANVARLTVGGVPDGPPGGRDEKYRAACRAFMSSAARRPVHDGEIDFAALKEYDTAFRAWLRYGQAIGELQNAMRVGSDPDGGFWVPPQFLMEIQRRIHDDSPMRQVATVRPMTAGEIELPTDPNDLTSGGWVAESSTRGETASPQIGLQRLFAREQFAQPEVTQKLLDDAAIDVDSWLVDKIVSKFLRDEGSAFTSGVGVTSPRGFLTYPVAADDDGPDREWGTLQYVPSGSASGFPKLSGSSADDADSLITLQLKLRPEYQARATWMMSRGTASVIRRLKDADGRFLWTDNLAEGQRPLLLGARVMINDFMPSIASDALAVAYGDFSHYWILDRLGVRVLRDPFTKKGTVRFYATKRVAGDVVGEGFDSIKLLKFSVS
jgi:HK97 family phage major capsid protein